MIHEPTVLVLGAGASMDFQYPSGFGLKRRVLDVLGPQQPIRALVQACGFDQLSIQNFRTALAHSGALSVDTFLEHQSQYLALGKAAIAAALIPLENADNLFPPSSSPTWLELLLQRLHGPLDSWNNNQLSVVTFNYDRVIEQFFSQALMSRYRISLQKAAALLQETVSIVHVHGSLGALPHFNTLLSRPYSPQLSTPIIQEAASGIMIVHEGTSGSPEFEKAKELIRKSVHVVFIGFGYNPTNLERLDIRRLGQNLRLMGTSVGMTPIECVVAKEAVGVPINIDTDGFSPVEFLRNYRILGL